jgi:hypothetical protein
VWWFAYVIPVIQLAKAGELQSRLNQGKKHETLSEKQLKQKKG